MKKHKLFLTFVPAIFMLISCGQHAHTFSKEWTKDNEHHWHEATCEHSDEKANYEEHTFSEWSVKTEAGYHVDRVEERKCTVCDFKEEKTIDGTATHIFENIEHDDEHHYLTCDCGEKTDIEAHVYGDWYNKTNIGVDIDKQIARKCKECEFEQIKTFEGTKTNGDYAMVITNTLKMSDGKMLLVKMLRGSVEVGDNLQINGLPGEFNIEKLMNEKKVDISKLNYGETGCLYLDDDNDNIKAGYVLTAVSSVKSYSKFEAIVHFDFSEKSTNLITGNELNIDLYDVNVYKPQFKLQLPEGVNVVNKETTLDLTITFQFNDSRSIWNGLEFSVTTTDNSKIGTGIVVNTLS